MGTSTNGQICYGIAFEEGFKFPWGTGDDGEEDAMLKWWIYEAHGFKHDFELYDEDGEYLGGAVPSDEQRERYWKPYYAFQKAHPLPVELVNYCSGDYPMWILAVPRTVKVNHRGDAVAFNPEALTVTEEEKQALIGFCRQHGIENGEPEWYLSSVWM